MEPNASLYVNARWPYYRISMVVALFLGLMLMALGVMRGNWIWLPLGAFVILGAAYVFAATSWIMRRLLDFRPIAAAIWQLSALNRSDDFLYIETGMRNIAIEVSKFLLSGRITIVDVFNPQLMPDNALLRTRKVAYENVLLPLSDPRTIWIDGNFDRLPRLENSAKVIVLDQVLCEMVQQGDRKRLLDESYRVLEPGGRLVMVERIAAVENRWLSAVGGVGGWDWAESWQQTLAESHFAVATVEPVNALLTAFQAIKPAPNPRQLELPIFAEQRVEGRSLRNM